MSIPEKNFVDETHRIADDLVDIARGLEATAEGLRAAEMEKMAGRVASMAEALFIDAEHLRMVIGSKIAEDMRVAEQATVNMVNAALVMAGNGKAQGQ